jgi:hypothetical protein
VNVKKKLRPKGTMENKRRISAVPSGRILFCALNPARCAGLISVVPVGTRDRAAKADGNQLLSQRDEENCRCQNHFGMDDWGKGRLNLDGMKAIIIVFVAIVETLGLVGCKPKPITLCKGSCPSLRGDLRGEELVGRSRPLRLE